MPSSYLDQNPGWFAGRASLDLVGETFVNDAFFYTRSLDGNNADVHAKVDLEHTGTLGFKGKIIAKMGIWEKEGPSNMETVIGKDVLIGPGIKTFEFDFSLTNPKLWTPESPALYKVVIEVRDNTGTVIDDFVLTTGRTVTEVAAFKPKFDQEGLYFIEYFVDNQ